MKHHFEKKGLRFVGQDEEGERMEIIDLEGEWPMGINHPYASNKYNSLKHTLERNR